MVFNLLKKAQKFKIGLDITSEGITAVLLERRHKTISLKNLAYEPFLEPVIHNGEIVNSQVFIDTLQRLLDEHDFQETAVNIGIPSNIAFIKAITLPDLPHNELMVIAPQEAAKHIPLPLEEVNIDFEVLENTRRQTESGKKVDVVLAASAKSAISSYINHIQSLNLNVSAVDISSFAMIRTLANTDLIDNTDSIFISVLIGYENTDISIIHKGMPLFSNNTPVGKRNVIDSLLNSLETNEAEIRKMLPEIALIIPGMNVEEMDPQLSKASAAVRTVYNSISSEIQKTIEFYYSQNSDSREIKRIIIGGSGVCIQNIDKYIANRLKIDTALCDSLNNLSNIDEKMISGTNIPALATSVGLALKGMQD